MNILKKHALAHGTIPLGICRAATTVLAVLLTLGGIQNSEAGITQLPTSEVGLVGYFARGPVDVAVTVDANAFAARFGSETPWAWTAEVQARAFFQQGGNGLTIVRAAPGQSLEGAEARLSGMHALDTVADLRLLLIPELTLLPTSRVRAAVARVRQYVDERKLFAILDPPQGLDSARSAGDWADRVLPSDAAGLATYYPYLKLDVGGSLVTAGASGTMAAIYQANDASSGIWDPPAGGDLPLVDVDLSENLGDGEIDSLNTKHVNAIRRFPPVGVVPWGSRTRDIGGSETRFVSSSRVLRWLEASITRGLTFAAFEANDAALWDRLRTSVEELLLELWQNGALLGATPKEAFFVRCDQTTTTPVDISNARAVVRYGVALIRPSEFALTVIEVPTLDPERPIPPTQIFIRRAGDDLHLAWRTVPGFRYQRQSARSLRFTPSELWIAGDGEWRRERIAIESRQGYHRVIIEPGN